VVGIVGSGTEEDPVAGIELESGDRITAPWVFGADGRGSTVAGQLGLEKRDRLAGEFGILYGYWRGLPETGFMHMDVHQDEVLTWGPCEDDLHILTYNGPAEVTRGSAAERRRRYVEGVRRFPDTLSPDSLDAAEPVGEVHVAPESMMRGYYRRANGPGWALVGDSGHFKHPATAQGISDAVEQAVYLAKAVLGGGDLDGYEAWRDERSAEHYKFSFDMGRFPRPEVADPIFAGIAADERAAQDFRDVLSRLVLPSEALSKERLRRWFAQTGAPTSP
jgi:2-polyprenyl-6-methoxyphenol hydroxylase-like FAD-dependent oxidoreductase